jgi:hypothetical protein
VPELKQVKTIPFGIIRASGPRKETVVRLTKTLVITDKGRYDRKTGMTADYYNRSVGAYKLSPEDKKKYSI